MKIFGPSLEKSKIRAAKEKCAGDTQYRRAHFDAGCVDFGESDDVENIFNTLEGAPFSNLLHEATQVGKWGAPFACGREVDDGLGQHSTRRLRSSGRMNSSAFRCPVCAGENRL